MNHDDNEDIHDIGTDYVSEDIPCRYCSAELTRDDENSYLMINRDDDLAACTACFDNPAFLAAIRIALDEPDMPGYKDLIEQLEYHNLKGLLK